MAIGGGRWIANPDASESTIFQGVVAAIGAFRLLQAQPDVDRRRLGIIGISWGGYTTTILAGLLRREVKAAYSVYGSGHYEEAVFANEIAKMPAVEQRKWYEQLDAGAYSSEITAAYFVAAATNDSFFYPPAVMATLDSITNNPLVIFGPNADHSPTGYAGGPPRNPEENWTAQEVDFFDYYLRDVGHRFPECLTRNSIQKRLGDINDM